jgi:NAD(P)-dependent dehydrogenase (short-subunit alcohol dehydrogenase family)
METDMTMALAANGIPEGLFSLMSIGRLAQLEEVAAAVVFLATPAASYITGSVIEANGGYMA